jgi:hypothetical protein
MEKCDSTSSISFGTENTQYNVVPSLREWLWDLNKLSNVSELWFFYFINRNKNEQL